MPNEPWKQPSERARRCLRTHRLIIFALVAVATTKPFWNANFDRQRKSLSIEANPIKNKKSDEHKFIFSSHCQREKKRGKMKKASCVKWCQQQTHAPRHTHTHTCRDTASERMKPFAYGVTWRDSLRRLPYSYLIQNAQRTKVESEREAQQQQQQQQRRQWEQRQQRRRSGQTRIRNN